MRWNIKLWHQVPILWTAISAVLAQIHLYMSLYFSLKKSKKEKNRTESYTINQYQFLAFVNYSWGLFHLRFHYLARSFCFHPERTRSETVCWCHTSPHMSVVSSFRAFSSTLFSPSVWESFCLLMMTCSHSVSRGLFGLRWCRSAEGTIRPGPWQELDGRHRHFKKWVSKKKWML